MCQHDKKEKTTEQAALNPVKKVELGGEQSDFKAPINRTTPTPEEKKAGLAKTYSGLIKLERFDFWIQHIARELNDVTTQNELYKKLKEPIAFLFSTISNEARENKNEVDMCLAYMLSTISEPDNNTLKAFALISCINNEMAFNFNELIAKGVPTDPQSPLKKQLAFLQTLKGLFPNNSYGFHVKLPPKRKKKPASSQSKQTPLEAYLSGLTSEQQEVLAIYHSDVQTKEEAEKIIQEDITTSNIRSIPRNLIKTESGRSLTPPYPHAPKNKGYSNSQPISKNEEIALMAEADRLRKEWNQANPTFLAFLDQKFEKTEEHTKAPTPKNSRINSFKCAVAAIIGASVVQGLIYAGIIAAAGIASTASFGIAPLAIMGTAALFAGATTYWAKRQKQQATPNEAHAHQGSDTPK